MTTPAVMTDDARPSRSCLMVAPLLALAAAAADGRPASAQPVTSDPSAWRPLAYSDLRQRSETTRTYIDIWQDALDANNRLYAERGDLRFRGENAPATEAHFVVWSPTRSVVVTILNTATGCTLKEIRTAAAASVKLCPLRVAVYEGVKVSTLDGGQACFVERSQLQATVATAPISAATLASYDPASRNVKLGVVIDHQPVEGCSHVVPVRLP